MDKAWLVEVVKELLDDHGRFLEETTMSAERYDEIRGVVFSDPSTLPSPPPKGAEGVMSVGEIISRCNDAMSKMGKGNPHRFLLYTAASALHQLVQRLDKFERPAVGAN